MDPADKFRNLLLMAASDGRMSESELRLLSHRATELGITDDQFEDAIHEALSGRASLVMPADPDERQLMLKDLIRMMAADGKMASGEKHLFALASTVLGVEAEALDRLIDAVLEEDP
jgi:uncharacterized tellurite resistance protein B-like protein